MNIQPNDNKSVFSIADLFDRHTLYETCLEPLLEVLDWHGDKRHLAEALPFSERELDLYGLLHTLKNLDFVYSRLTIDLKDIEEKLTPFMFVVDEKPIIVYEVNKDEYAYFDPELKEMTTAKITSQVGEMFIFKSVKKETLRSSQQEENWFLGLCQKNKRVIYQLLTLTFFLNVFTIVSSLFVMTVYDKVVGNDSSRMLWSLCSGMVIVIACAFMFSMLRSKVLAYIGAKIDLVIGKAILQRLFRLPIYYIENTNIGAQISRLKDFDSVREFFTGSLFSVAFELPFVFLYIIVIAFVGGPLAWIPLLLVIAYVLAYQMTAQAARRHVKKTSELSSRKQQFLVETIENIKSIKLAAGENIWRDRYADLSAECSLANFRSGRFTSIINSIADASVVLAVASMLAWGVYLVINQSITVGGLIATLILVWRVLNPIKTVFVSITRFEQLKSGIKQINNLMTLPPERKHNIHLTPIDNLKGHISIEGVSHRYPEAHKSCLNNVELKLEPNKIIAITGTNGAGKSTLLKLLIGLYPIQSGAIRLDDVDIRQFDPIELRHAIAYSSQNSELFYGTILDNIRLSNLTATQAEIERAVKLAGLQEDIAKLPDGINTKLKGEKDRIVSHRMRRQIGLARTFAKDSKIMLLDEPGADLGDTNFILMNSLMQLKKEKAVVVVTQQMLHLENADEIIVMNDGQVLVHGPAREVLEKLAQQP